MKQEGKNNGGKVIWREIVFPALYDCRIILSLDVPRCYKAASKHLSHIGEWRSASQCFTLHHSCGKQCWQRLLQLSVPSPELAQLLNTSSPMHILLHLNHVSTTSEPSKDSCVCDYHAGCENIICSTVSWYTVNYENTSFPWFDSCNIPSLQGCGSAERRMVKSFAHETGHQSHPEFWPHIFGCLQSL